jgi:voltage-gated sodium channel
MERPAFRERLRALVEAPWFQRFVIALIVVNAVTLGLETWPAAMARAGDVILMADRVMLAVFVAEIVLRIIAHGGRFFRDPWGVFDVVVVGIALVPAANGAAVLRALRVLRVLRLISAVPRMRLVVQALLSAIPGIGAIVLLLSLIYYVSAVMATKLFGAAFPDWFGSIGASLYSLFQIMTLESWSMGIVRPVMAEFPLAWAFFVPFILVTTFTVLNLFIAVVVSAMQSEHEAGHQEVEAEAHREREVIASEVRRLSTEIAALRAALAPPPAVSAGLSDPP